MVFKETVYENECDMYTKCSKKEYQMLHMGIYGVISAKRCTCMIHVVDKGGSAGFSAEIK